MRDQFPGYYKPTEKDFDALWQECFFIFDANTLLNMYRYSSGTRESFLDILSRLSERIWIPYQAAYEYQENRLTVISDQTSVYDAIKKWLEQERKSLGELLGKYKRHSLLDANQVDKIITAAFQEIEKKIEETEANHPDLLDDDEIRDAITKLFHGKVGEPYSDKDKEEKLKEADIRLKNQVPPGYKDAAKTDTKKYGDMLIWFELIDFAKANKKPILFITDDKKEDWWLIHKGKTIGPRPELIQEMKTKTDIPFYMYQTDQFITYAQKFLRLQDQQAVIDEVKDVSNRYDIQVINSERVSEGIALLAKALENSSYNEQLKKAIESQAAFTLQASRVAEALSTTSLPIDFLAEMVSRIADANSYQSVKAIQRQMNLISEDEYQATLGIINELNAAKAKYPSVKKE